MQRIKLDNKILTDTEKIKQAIKAIESISEIPEDLKKISVFVFQTFLIIVNQLYTKNCTIKKLLGMLFGAKTEKKSKKCKTSSSRKARKPRPKTPSETTLINHTKLKSGDVCPECNTGKLYHEEPKKEEVYQGQSPFVLKLFLYAVLRCNFCGRYFTASETDEVKENRAAGISNLAILRYGFGLPHYRIEMLGDAYNIPFPASTQWDLLSDNAFKLEPVYNYLLEESANAELYFADDTTNKILNKKPVKINEETRKKIYTTGIICKFPEKMIVTFFTGHKNAGERMDDLLKHRSLSLPPPLYMRDASSSNDLLDKSSVISVFCNAHNRRKYVEIESDYPRACSVVIACYMKIYHHDKITKELGMNPEERLHYHQQNSTKYFNLMYKWLERLIKLKIEPANSKLGEAIKYSFKNKKYLDRFLEIPGVPLDNNLCEQMLKRIIIHRKNSLFYKTQRGADIGDMFSTIIITCMQNRINPLEYLNAIQLNYIETKTDPEKWMPWNYKNNS